MDTTSRPWVFSVGTIEDNLFDYDLGFGEQQLILISQVITSSSKTPRDFPKQTPLNSTAEASGGGFAIHQMSRAYGEAMEPASGGASGGAHERQG